MFRNGGSEYAINGNHCRLLDVQELLSDSGIGREMHVIVGQGQLDSILHATPEDRRGFIEEAAGVLKHRKRKEKALRKLESTDGNLTRLADLLSEIRRQLKPLGRQAEVARRAASSRPTSATPAPGCWPTTSSPPRTALRAGARRRVDPARAPDRGRDGARRDPRDRGRARGRAARGPAGAGRGAGDLVRAVRAARAAPRHRQPGRRAGPQRRRRSPRCPTGRDPEELEAEAARVRAQEDEILAEVERQPRRPRRRRRAPARPPSRPFAEEERRVAGLQRAAADRREGLARLHGQVNALRSRAAAAEDEVGRLTEARAEAVARAERAQHDFTSLETRVAGLDAGEEGLDAEHEAASCAARRPRGPAGQDPRGGSPPPSASAASLAARKEALELGLNRKDGAGALLAATDSVSGLLGSVAALLTVRTGYEAAVAAALGQRRRRGRGPRRRRRARRDRPPQGRRPRPRRDPARRRPTVDDAAWPGLPAGAAYAIDVVECPADAAPGAGPAAVQGRRRRRPGRRPGAGRRRCPTSPR